MRFTHARRVRRQRDQGRAVRGRAWHGALVRQAYIHFELDGATDIQAAYDILCGHHSIRGDVPAMMLAFGTVDEVNEYCEKLVTMGMKGGFMLSSGCEVPTNVKVDNLKAFINFLK